MPYRYIYARKNTFSYARKILYARKEDIYGRKILYVRKGDPEDK